MSAEYAVEIRHRLETLGLMTGGIMVEFNELLTTIMLAGNVLHTHLPTDLSLQEILEAAQRGMTLTRRLLTYHCHSAPPLTVIALSEVLTQAVELLRRVLPPLTTIRLHLGGLEAPMIGNSEQLISMVLALGTQAQQAIALQQGYGAMTLTLRQRAFTTAQTAIAGFPLLSAGAYWQVTFHDTGAALTTEQQRRFFEPFYQVDRTDNGDIPSPGMGLAWVQQVLCQHGGALEIETPPSGACLIQVYLPGIGGKQDTATGEGRGDAATRRHGDCPRVAVSPPLRVIIPHRVLSIGHVSEVLRQLMQPPSWQLQEVDSLSETMIRRYMEGPSVSYALIVVGTACVVQPEASVLLWRLRALCPGVPFLLCCPAEGLPATCTFLAEAHCLQPCVPEHCVAFLTRILARQQVLAGTG